MLPPPGPTGLICSYQNYYKMSKAVLPQYSRRIRSLYIQTQFENISIESIIFMLQIVTNMNETLIILHLQQMAGI
jgi:hypothetical protein